MARQVQDIFAEALIIGLLFGACWYIAEKMFPAAQKVSLAIALGFLFHIACEAAGINQWFCYTRFRTYQQAS